MKRMALLVVVVVLVSLCGCTMLTEGVGTYSSGSRTGYVFKYSKKGTLKKSGEGQLLLGFTPSGFYPAAEGEGKIANVWAFSVNEDTHPEVVKKLDQAMIEGRRVVLHYEQKQISGYKFDTDSLVEKVEFAPEMTPEAPE